MFLSRLAFREAAALVMTLSIAALLGAGAVAIEPSTSSAAPLPYSSLAWRSIGPALSGGRVTAVVGLDSNPFLYYVGSAGGGVYKTIDGGAHWQAVFDGQPVAPI